MKRAVIRTLTQLAFTLTAAGTVYAAPDLVDFGDSGIVVEVQASGSGKEYGVAYIPWVPDEFYILYPALPAAPGIPWPAGWGSEPEEPDPCQVAMDHLAEIENEIVWRQDAINFGNDNGFVWDGYGDGQKVFRGGGRFEEIMELLESEVAELRQEREHAADEARRYCGPQSQT